jgi:hypothetical protein
MLRLTLAFVLTPMVLFLAPRTLRPGWLRPVFVLVLLALDALLLAELFGSAGPKSAAAAVLLVPVLLLPLVGFIYWWSAADAFADARQIPPLEAVEHWLSLEPQSTDAEGAHAPGNGCVTRVGMPSAGERL